MRSKGPSLSVNPRELSQPQDRARGSARPWKLLETVAGARGGDSGPLTPGDSHHLRARLQEQKGTPAPKTGKPSPAQPCPTSQTPLTSKYPCSSEDSEAGLEMLEGCPPPPTLCTPAPSVSRSASGHPRLSAPSGSWIPCL